VAQRFLVGARVSVRGPRVDEPRGRRDAHAFRREQKQTRNDEREHTRHSIARIAKASGSAPTVLASAQPSPVDMAIDALRLDLCQTSSPTRRNQRRQAPVHVPAESRLEADLVLTAILAKDHARRASRAGRGRPDQRYQGRGLLRDGGHHQEQAAKRISTWAVQLEIPALLVNSGAIGTYVQNMSDQKLSVFRTSPGFAKQEPLWPAQAYAHRVPYRMTEELQGVGLLKARATVYVNGEIKGEQTKVIRDICGFFLPAVAARREATRALMARAAQPMGDLTDELLKK
jgi:hypothetical protein